jgi:tetratricopeptide (TPR) repeat protein
LWAGRPSFSRSDQAEVHDRIAARLVQAVEIRLMDVESRRGRRERPDAPDAEDLATRGYALVNGRVTAETNEQALRLFEAALAQDGKSIGALLGLARTELNAVTNQWAPADERAARLDRIEAAVNRAVALSPDNSFGQRIRGGLMRARGEPEQAIAAFTRAIELDPNDAAAHAELGRTKIDVGLARETIGHIEEAVRINPHDRDLAFWYFWAGQAAVHVGDADQAVLWLRKAIEAHPNYINPLPWLAIAYALQGRDEEARRCIDQFRAARPNFTISGWDAAYRRTHPAVVAQLEPTREVLRRLNVPD